MEILSGKKSALSAPGEITIRQVSALKEDLLAVLEKGKGKIVLKMDAVEQIDTAAIQVLLAAKKTAQKEGRAFELQNPSDTCQEVAIQLGLEGALFGP